MNYAENGEMLLVRRGATLNMVGSNWLGEENSVIVNENSTRTAVETKGTPTRTFEFVNVLNFHEIGSAISIVIAIYN